MPTDRPHVIAVGGAETGIEVAGEIKTAWPSGRGAWQMVSRSRRGGDFRGARVEKAVALNSRVAARIRVEKRQRKKEAAN